MRLHKGVLERVAVALFTCPAYTEILEGYLAKEGEVERGLIFCFLVLLVLSIFLDAVPDAHFSLNVYNILEHFVYFWDQAILNSYIESQLIHSNLKIFMLWVSTANTQIKVF